jgi:hypothetical protein
LVMDLDETVLAKTSNNLTDRRSQWQLMARRDPVCMQEWLVLPWVLSQLLCSEDVSTDEHAMPSEDRYQAMTREDCNSLIQRVL